MGRTKRMSRPQSQDSNLRANSDKRRQQIAKLAKQQVKCAEALKKLGAKVRDWDNFGMVEIEDEVTRDTYWM